MLIQRNTKKKNTESFVKECILKNSKSYKDDIKNKMKDVYY